MAKASSWLGVVVLSLVMAAHAQGLEDWQQQPRRALRWGWLKHEQAPTQPSVIIISAPAPAPAPAPQPQQLASQPAPAPYFQSAPAPAPAPPAPPIIAVSKAVVNYTPPAAPPQIIMAPSQQLASQAAPVPAPLPAPAPAPVIITIPGAEQKKHPLFDKCKWFGCRR